MLTKICNRFNKVGQYENKFDIQREREKKQRLVFDLCVLRNRGELQVLYDSYDSTSNVGASA
jgi:hypothetical protein